MSDLTLAQLSMLSLYSAMGVFTLAMIGYAVYLAGLMPARAEASEKAAVQSTGKPADAAMEADAAMHAAGDRELAAVGAVGAAGGAKIAAGADDVAAAQLRRAGGVSSGVATRPMADEVPTRARKAAGMAWTLTILGTALLTAAVFLRGAEVHRAPLGNMFEFAIVGCMFVMLAFTAWSFRRDLRWLGVFVVTPVLLTLGLAITIWYTDAKELMPSLKSYWLVIHVTVATLSVALFAIGAVLGALYLWQSHVEAAGARSFMNKLPTARALEKLTHSLHVIAFPLWTFTVIAGAIWARQAWGSYWNWDPKEVWSFVIWVVYAAYLHARVTSGWRPQSATWIALAGFGCIILNYAVVNMYFVGQHSYSGL